MKIPASIRNMFDGQVDKYNRLRVEADNALQQMKEPRWHYESRVKTLDSYALKLETGRVRDPSALEDFFACTLVVGNLADVAIAESRVAKIFEVNERRPPKSNETKKRPEEFSFDDLRLYVSLREDTTLPPTGLEGVRFECQIKTFLQHAWAIATHDLVYKTDDVNWSKQRIAYQTKAVLEHAEISILQAEELAASTALAMETTSIADLKRTIAILRAQWPNDELPSDLRRLAENVLALFKALKVDLSRLQSILDEGKAIAGSHPSNLSPFGTIVQYLLSTEGRSFNRCMRNGDSKYVVVIPAEINLPDDADRNGWVNAVRIR